MGRGVNLPPGMCSARFRSNPVATRTPKADSHGGLGQFSPALEARYGINDTNRTDPTTQAGALAMGERPTPRALARTLGPRADASRYYLAHQQASAARSAHLSQPNLPAWQNWSRTVEGARRCRLGQGRQSGAHDALDEGAISGVAWRTVS